MIWLKDFTYLWIIFPDYKINTLTSYVFDHSNFRSLFSVVNVKDNYSAVTAFSSVSHWHFCTASAEVCIFSKLWTLLVCVLYRKLHTYRSLSCLQTSVFFNLLLVSHLRMRVFDSFRYKNRHFTGLGAKTAISV
jgi:hypothetical protein